mmetsp:Transcript_24511/g.85201  ORF Transcript_24511/g.85201 Transcript_24511/m.85201 type:complete len:236 (-) Transcript_24511:320-1027(-)
MRIRSRTAMARSAQHRSLRSTQLPCTSCATPCRMRMSWSAELACVANWYTRANDSALPRVMISATCASTGMRASSTVEIDALLCGATGGTGGRSRSRYASRRSVGAATCAASPLSSTSSKAVAASAVSGPYVSSGTGSSLSRCPLSTENMLRRAAAERSVSARLNVDAARACRRAVCADECAGPAAPATASLASLLCDRCEKSGRICSTPSMNAMCRSPAWMPVALSSRTSVPIA